MKKPAFNHYFKYEELTSVLEGFVQEYPGFIKLESLCVTKDGHHVWIATLTDYAAGDAAEKPAFYLDGNLHACEVTASMATVHLIYTLLSEHDKNPVIKELLSRATFYVIPRIAVDGAEIFLSSEKYMRSTNIMYPFEKPEPGLHAMDIDSDGIIRQMRIPSSSGKWKVSSRDPRLMVKRLPSDKGGTYYNVYSEGDIIGEYDGYHIKPARPMWGMDFNRNFPFGWDVEGRQPGSGDYPLCHTETKALADFVLSHPNICNSLTYHCSGGVFLSVPSTMPVKEADQQDMRMFKELGAMATAETGYPCVNCYESTYGGVGMRMSGSFDDWMYQALGIPCYTVELWDLRARAGVKVDFNATDNKKTDDEREEEVAKVYSYLDAHLSEGWFKPWCGFEHPTLGYVEIGGANSKFIFHNPPEHLLEEVIAPHTRFCIKDALSMPQLDIIDMKAKKDGSVYKITAAVTNSGYMSTYITSLAKKLKADKKLIASLHVDGGKIISGKAEEEIGHLEGYGNIPERWSYEFVNTGRHDPLTRVLTWVVDAPIGTIVTLKIHSEKCGQVERSIVLIE